MSHPNLTEPSTAASVDPALMDFSRAVHTLYRDAQSLDVPSFERHLFRVVREALPFDSAWMGHSTLTPSGPQLHSNALCDLPAHYLQDWTAVQDMDPLVDWANQAPPLPITLSIADPSLKPAFRQFLGHQGIAQILCAARVEGAVRTCLHVSLYRSSLKPAFCAADHGLLSALMPHLASAINWNRMRTLEHLVQPTAPSRTGAALISRQGVVQYADPMFAELVLLEWPQWAGGTLPDAATMWVHPGQSRRYLGQRVSVEFTPHGDLVCAAVRALGRASLLTARERMVATLFARGLTYKEVARDLHIAPATVRHHLRRVYTALGVRNKGAIAAAMAEGIQPNPP